MVPLEQHLSVLHLEQLRTILLEVSAGDQQIILHHADIPAVSDWQSFELFFAPGFSALLELSLEPSLNSPEERASPWDTIKFSLDTHTISQYLTRLQEAALSPKHQAMVSAAIALHESTMAHSGSGDNSRYHQLSLKLIALLAQTSLAQTSLTRTSETPALASACQPMIVHAALTQQSAQEALIHRVTTQIRQSLELPEILSTAAAQVRQILEVDRFVIYQFQSFQSFNTQFFVPLATSSSRSQPIVAQSLTQPAEYREINAQKTSTQKTSTRKINAQITEECIGAVTYESLADSSISSVLHFQEQYCWHPVSASMAKFQAGQVLAIADVAPIYADSDCMLNFLQAMRVKAKLVVPVLVKSKLWGLLIAHQCHRPRAWQEPEIGFLQKISEHLSVAIAQSELYHQLRVQKTTLEQQVQQRTQELQDALISSHAANQAKSEFLATMSHELRTPLTCVIGMSATLLQWSLGPLSEKQRSYLQTIHDSGEHLLELINDILDLSNLEAGKATLSVGEFSLSSLAHQSLQLLRDKAKSSEISLKAHIKIPTDQDRFIADPRQIKQILVNLLSNAIKFTPSGGTVTLRLWMEGDAVILQVEDTGIGIPKEKQSLLFQKFQQLDTSYQRSYDGAGLGLALVKQFVEMHRGWIEVQSDEGQGTIFTVEIPNQATRADNHAAGLVGSALSPIASSGRILMIEQQDENAGLVCDILTAAGFQVIWMVEGISGMPTVKILQPLVVIINTHLSQEDCLEMIQQVRHESDIAATKLIVLLDEAFEADPQAFLQAGADAYLFKPINPEHLLYKIERLVANTD